MTAEAPKLTVRPVTDEDCHRLWEWVNDPAVRAMSFCSEPIRWEEHAAWFRARRADPQRVIFIVLDEAQRPIGQVRFEPQDKTGGAEVVISIAAACRGQGYGTEAIRVACEAYRRLGLGRRIMAYIKPKNLASIRLFEKAGFADQGRTPFRGHEAVCMHLAVHSRTVAGDPVPDVRR